MTGQEVASRGLNRTRSYGEGAAQRLTQPGAKNTAGGWVCQAAGSVAHAIVSLTLRRHRKYC